MRDSELLKRFETFEVEAADFSHRDHVQVAFEMLKKYSFLEASAKYSNGINIIATNAGVPERFHVTITLAFLSLIAQRVDGSEQDEFEAFLSQNEDLLNKDVLSQWYSKEDLSSDFARTHFLLPRGA